MAKQRVLSEADAKELLRESAARIQRIDQAIKELQEEKRDILKKIKDEGLNTKILNEAIRTIRKAKKDPSFIEEVEMYEGYIENIINPL